MPLDLFSLAPEIIQVIGCMLSVDDLGYLRLACKRLSEILESAVLHRITLNINSRNFSKNIPKLRALAAGRSPNTARATTHLSVVCLSPRHDPTKPSAILVGDDRVTISEGLGSPSTSNPEVVEGERRLKKYLLDAILSLKNITTVRWFTHKRDETWVQDIMMKALKGLPKLENLYIDATWLQVILPLQRLQPLHEITITKAPVPNEKNFYKTCSNLGKLAARNPGITSIHLDRARFPALPSLPIDPGSSLHSLFLCYPLNTPPLRLRHLGLRHMFVKLDDITLPHLQHLTSLDLSFMLEPRHRSSLHQDGDESSSTTAEGEHAVGSHINHIWDVLAKSHIYLEEITLTNVTPAFLDYIELYSGLKKVSLSSFEFKNGKESDDAAARFWDRSLPKHVTTIERLEVEATLEGKWCLYEHNLAIVKQCRALKLLQVCILSASLLDCVADQEEDSENIVVLLIDNASCYLPNLENLIISTPNPESSRGSCHETDVGTYRQEVENLIINQLETYVAPPSCNLLPRVTVGSNNYCSKIFIPDRALGNMARFESGEWHYRRDIGQKRRE